MVNYEQIISILDEKGLDAIIISDRYNMRYVSGYKGDTGMLVLFRDKRYVLTDFRYIFMAMADTKDRDYEVVDIAKQKGYTASINSILNEHKCTKIGFENTAVSYMQYKSFSKDLAGKELIELGDTVTKLRVIKDADELECIKMAESIGDKAFTEILNFIKPGVTEMQVAAHLEYTMKMNGAEALSFDTIVASGINSSMPHAMVSDKKIENGDFVTMDFGCVYRGYCSDMTRTIVVGKASDKQKHVYNTVLQAQLAALDFIKAGVKGKEVDAVARKIIDDAGYKGCFGHGLGHSVGLEIHESPNFNPSEESIILANTIETVEPGVYIKDFGGVRIEDLVVVTKEGHINYTKSPKELIEL
ncbi:MAG: aminopeptidase P family protein [Lachnospiraceae bacterium]|nr:aminopeptidase P family protein [Lachnospiraceae bacterium]